MLGTEGCYDKSTPPVFIAEALKFTSKPDDEVQRALPGLLRTRGTKPAARWRRTSSSAS